MSKKIISIIAAGILTGISVPFVVDYLKSRKSRQISNSYRENVMIKSANQFLLNAEGEVQIMVKNATDESTSIIDQANKVLTTVKEETESFHKAILEGNKEEIIKMKEVIDEEIRRLSKD